MNKLIDFFEDIGNLKYVNSVIIILISFTIYKLIIYLIRKYDNNDSIKMLKSKKSKTYLKLTKSIIRYIFIVITILLLLQVNGVNVNSMLTGVGILSIILGFAVQDALKDIIRGIAIITDSYYQVGDIIKFGNIEGKVLAIGLKTTKIEDVLTFNIISIANRNIEQVEIVSNLINIDIPMPYELKVEAAESAIKDVLDLVKQLEHVDKCEYRGVQNFADSSIKYQIKVYCAPILKVQMRRDVLRCVLLGLEKNNIAVPYTQIDIHSK